MKQLITLMALLAFGISSSWAQQITTWNFSNLKNKEYSKVMNLDGLKLYASADKRSFVDAHEKTINGDEYTQRLKLGGSASFKDKVQKTTPNSRVLEFDVTGDCMIEIGAASAGKYTDEDRILNVDAYTNGVTTNLAEFKETHNPEAQMLAYKGGAAKIRVYSPNKGVNLYYIKIAPAYQTITVPSEGYVAVSAPYALNFIKMRGLTPMAVTNFDGVEATAVELTTNVIPANTGIIVKGKPGTYKVPYTVTNNTIDNNVLKAAAKASVKTDGTLYGLSFQKNKVGFKKVNMGSAIQAGMAYLALPEGAETKAKDFAQLEGNKNGVVVIESFALKLGAAPQAKEEKVYKKVVAKTGKKYAKK